MTMFTPSHYYRVSDEIDAAWQRYTTYQEALEVAVKAWKASHHYRLHVESHAIWGHYWMSRDLVHPLWDYEHGRWSKTESVGVYEKIDGLSKSNRDGSLLRPSANASGDRWRIMLREGNWPERTSFDFRDFEVERRELEDRVEASNGGFYSLYPRLVVIGEHTYAGAFKELANQHFSPIKTSEFWALKEAQE